MPDFFSNAASDNFRLIKSKPLSGAVAAGTWALIRIPKWAYISKVWVWVQTAASATDVSVGWMGNTETAQAAGFMSTGVLKANVVGYKEAVNDTIISFGQKYFDKGTGAITATLGTTWSSGKIFVFCQYSVVR